MKKIIFITLLLTICGCSSTMQKKHFNDTKEKITAVGIEFNYNGNKEKLGTIGTCIATFSDQNNQVISFKVKDKYFFFAGDNLTEINLSNIQCMNYRVFYNKCRLKNIANSDKNIFKQTLNSNRNIVYGGSIDVEWTPEVFKVNDLFLMGHMGLQDNGPILIRKREEYKDFVKFMKDEFDKNSSDIFNDSKR